jgi:hypothetical protein
VIASSLRRLNDRIASATKVPAQVVGVAEILFLVSFGFTMIEVDEYAAAIAVWIVLCFFWFAKVLDWKGLTGRVRTSVFLKLGHAIGVVGVCTLLIVWTNIKRDDKAWTALSKTHKPVSNSAHGPTTAAKPSEPEDNSQRALTESQPTTGPNINEVRFVFSVLPRSVSVDSNQFWIDRKLRIGERTEQVTEAGDQRGRTQCRALMVICWVR